MPDILTLVNRIQEQSKLLLQMCREYDMRKFWELERKFQELNEIYRLEDKLNKEYDPDNPDHERDIKKC